MTHHSYAFNGYVITYDDHADTIAQAIMEGGPVTASYDVYSDFVNYVGGVYVQSSQKQEGGHAVKIVRKKEPSLLSFSFLLSFFPFFSFLRRHSCVCD